LKKGQGEGVGKTIGAYQRVNFVTVQTSKTVELKNFPCHSQYRQDDFMNKLTTIKQKVTIPASPEEVYDALTDPKKHSEFTGSKATGKPKVGEKLTAWDGYSSGKYLELEKGKRIVQEWNIKRHRTFNGPIRRP
jgi:activator of HSP90 ATPase